MKRKMMIATLAAILVSLSVTGGTLAYFTTQAVVTNAVTTGKINIAIVENFNPQDAMNLAPTNPANPKKITKEVRIQNQGGEAFVRVKLLKKWGTIGADEVFTVNSELDTENIALYFREDSNWQQIGDYYYTKLEAIKGDEPVKSDLLLESFAFLAGANDDRYKGKTAHIDVVAEAIQKGNQAMEAEWGMTYDSETDQFKAFSPTTGE